MSAPAAIARQLTASEESYHAFGEELRRRPPTSILTVARGSSDHAAHFMAYLIMARMGKLVTSLPMSLVTLYQSNLEARGLLALAFSQSGQSPDLISPMKYFYKSGALTVAFVNDAASPLADAVGHVFPLHAGEERSVAATKSFIAQLVAGAHVVAAWQEDDALESAVMSLPAALESAITQDWSAAVEALADAERMFVIGRGTGLAVAMEAALKFKETCAVQAEAFSGAEVKHGPMALIDEGFPLLVFAPRGPAQEGLLRMTDEMRLRGARVLLAAPPGTPGMELPLAEAPSEDVEPIVAIQSFYLMIEALSRKRGFDPDRPRHLSKVTKTK